AEDGIRDKLVTGVQTCALPILVRLATRQPPVGVEQYLEMRPGIDLMPAASVLGHPLLHPRSLHHAPPFSKADYPAVFCRGELSKIGRASCRERVEIVAGAVWVR